MTCNTRGFTGRFTYYFHIQMTKRINISITIHCFFFMILLGKLNAQQNISQLKSKQVEKTILDLYDRGFWGSSNSLAWKSLSESNFSGLYEKSTLDKLKLIHVLNALQRGEENAVITANELYSNADESSKQLLSFSLSQYYFKKADYTKVVEHFNNTDPTYFSNEINEQIQLQRGIAYFSLKQFSDAKPFFQSIIQVGNSQYLKTAHYYLGFIAFSDKSYVEAYDHFKLLMTEVYYKTVVPFYISYIHYMQGDANGAIEIGERYLATENAFHLNEAKHLLATIYFNKGDFAVDLE